MSGKRPFLSTTFLTALGRAGGFVIPYFIAVVFGASRSTDAFFFAYSLIFALIGVFTYVFEAVLVPYLSERLKSPESLSSLSNTALFVSIPFVAGIGMGIGIFLTPALMAWSHWDLSSARLVSRIFLEMVPLLLLGVWIAQFNSLFYVHRQFWFGAISPLIRSVVVLLVLFFFNRPLGIHALTIGLVLGEIIRWGTGLVLLLRTTSWKLKFNWQETNKPFSDFLRQVGFQIPALLAMNLTLVTDQWFASRLGVGSVSLLSYADRLLQIPYALFVSGFLQVFLSSWSEVYYREPTIFWQEVRRDVRVVFMAAVPLVTILWFVRRPLVELLFGFNPFSRAQLDLLSDVFGWYVIGFASGLIRLLYGRMLLILKESRFYCFQAWTELGLNIVFNVLLSRRFGVAGLAMSTSLVYSISAVWLHFYLRPHQKKGAPVS